MLSYIALLYAGTFQDCLVFLFLLSKFGSNFSREGEKVK